MRHLHRFFLVASLLVFCSCSFDFGVEPDDETGPNIGRDSDSIDSKSGTADVDTQPDSTQEPDTESNADTDRSSATQADSDSEPDTESQIDLCPDDPNKTDPGLCGCGQDENCIPHVSTSKSAYDAFEHITVSYWGLPGNELDWVGLYHVGASHDDYLGYFYTFGQKNGTIDFGVLGPGNYEARLFFNDTYNLEFASSFTVIEPQAGLLQVPAEADCYANQNQPGANFGKSPTLLVDTDPDLLETFLKFTVSELPDRLQGVWLGLFFTDPSDEGPFIYPTDTGWSESATTWNNRPGVNGPLISDMGIVCTGWRFIDVSSVIDKTGTYSFALKPVSSDGVDLASRESTSKPKIVFVTVSE